MKQIENKKIARKAQEEMLGFVLIILLVVIAGVILLAVNINKPAEERKSTEARNLMESVLAYTTGCAMDYEPNYKDVKELIGSCIDGADCANSDVSACDALNLTLFALFDSSLDKEFKSGRINSYSFSVSGKDNSTIISLSKGNCSKSVVYGAYQPLISSGREVNLFFKLCYSNLTMT
jgi:hypothetical protein